MFECTRVECWSHYLFRTDSTNHTDKHTYEENGTATRNDEGYSDSVCRSADLLSCNAQYLPHILRYRGEKIGKEERKEKHVRRGGEEGGE